MILKLNDDGDLAIEANSFVWQTGTEEIRQNIIQRLRVFLGEWFLDKREGIPFFEQVLKKAPNPVILNTIFMRQITLTPGVIEILEFNMDLNETTRQLTISTRIRVKDGEITIDDLEVA